MTNGNTYEHLVGLDQPEQITFVVEAAPAASPLVDDGHTIGNLGDAELEARILGDQTPTPLDRCFTIVVLDDTVRRVSVNIPTPRDIVVMAAFPGEAVPTMVLYPPSVTRQKLSPGTIDVPIFNIDYMIHPVPPLSRVDCVSSAMNMMREVFEGTCCHELLLKAVRSQRNVIKGNFDRDSLKQAITLVERGCRLTPDTLLLNSEAFKVIRDDIDRYDGTIYGLSPIVFNPTRRGVEGRSYVLTSNFNLGIIYRIGGRVTREVGLSGDMAIHLTTSIGAIVTNRSALASIED